MACVLANMLSFLVFCNLFPPTVAAVLPRQQEDDVVDNNYSNGPSLAGTIILAIIAFIIFLIMLALVVFAVRKRRMAKRDRAFPSISWANSPALRVNFHSWQPLSSEASLPAASRATHTHAAYPTVASPEVVEMYPTSPFRTSFPVTVSPQARAL